MLCLASLCAAHQFTAPALAAAAPMNKITLQADNQTILKNPLMGWGLYNEAAKGFANADDYWKEQDANGSTKYASFFYVRARWSLMEPQEGKYVWDTDENYKKLLQGALDRGLKLSFRVFINSQDYPNPSTPLWVKDYGAQGRLIQGKWSPFPDDPIFLAKYGNFVKAFGKKYNDPAIVDVIDGYTVGAWGEAHSEQFLSKDGGKKALSEFARMYSANFDKVPLVLPFSGQVGFDNELKLAINPYGYGVRRDGLGSHWFTGDQKKNADSLYGKTLMIGEECYWQSYNGVPDGIHKDMVSWPQTLKETYDDAIKYHFNTLDLRTTDQASRWMRLGKEYVDAFAINGGYRIRPVEVAVPAKIKLGEKFEIKHVWTNQGNGYLPNNIPALNYKYQTAFALLDGAGQPVETFFAYDAEPSAWLHKANFPYQTELTANNIAAGTYTWGVAVVDAKNRNKPGIQLAVKNEKTKSGWVKLGKVDVTK